MDEIKALPSEAAKTTARVGDKALPSEIKATGSDKALPSDQINKLPNDVSTAQPDSKPSIAVVKENTAFLVQGTTLKDRIRNSTKDGGLKKVPDNFNNKDGDWVVINSKNSFEVLYLDHEQYQNISTEMVKRNYGILKAFWEEKIAAMTGAAKTQIIMKYGGEHGTERTIQNYSNLLKNAYEKISGEGIEKCFKEIDEKRRKEGEKNLRPTVRAVLSDGKYEPVELYGILEHGRESNLKDKEIREILIRSLKKNGFQPAENILVNDASTEKLLAVIWIADKYKTDHPEEFEKKETDPAQLLEHDFITATKRDKKLLPAASNFLYAKGNILGLDKAVITKLVNEWSAEHEVEIVADNQHIISGMPRLAIDKADFDFLNQRVGVSLSESFTISNTGGGILDGTIKVATNRGKNWLSVSQDGIDTSRHIQDIKFHINTDGLPLGLKDTGTIEIQSNGGTQTVSVNLSIEITEVALKRFRWQFIPALVLIVTSLLYVIGESFILWSLILFGLGFALSKPLFRYQSTSGKNLILPAWTMAGLFLLVIIIAQSLAPPQESSRVQFTVTAYKDVNANVRIAPSKSAESLGALKIQKGETFGILEAKGDWYKIETIIKGKDKVGWIYKDLVVKAEPFQPQAPSQEARPEPTPPSPPIARTDPEPAKPSVDIARIERDLNRTLRNRGLGEVYAKVGEDLTATLEGTVNNPRDKMLASYITKSFTEIKDVKSEIRVAELPAPALPPERPAEPPAPAPAPPPAPAPAPPPIVKIDPATLEGNINRALRNAGIRGVTAEVNDNLEVILSGSVMSRYERDRALEIANGFKEAKRILNRIIPVITIQ